MNEEEYNEDEYFKCKKCKTICEKIINERTNKPFTICENCRAKCGSWNKKNNEPPIWKQKLFNMNNNKKAININFEDVDVETETEQTEETENIDENYDEPKSINGELMAGMVMVENVDDDIKKDISTFSLNVDDDIKKDISTFSLNDKVKYIIDLLETTNNKGQRATTTTDDKNEKIYDMLYEMKATLNKDFIDIKNELKAMKQNIIDIKNNII
jgi:hypothetical protein